MTKTVRTQQVLLVLISLVLFGRFGVPGVVMGQAWVGPEAAASPLLDNEVRFLSALAIGLGVIVLSILKDVERHSTIVRIVALATLGGALARVWSIVELGAPPSRATAALGLELFFAVALLVLQARISARARPSGG